MKPLENDIVYLNTVIIQLEHKIDHIYEAIEILFDKLEKLEEE